MALEGIWQPVQEEQVIPSDGFSPVVTVKLMDTNHLLFKVQMWKQDAFEHRGIKWMKSNTLRSQGACPNVAWINILNWFH